MARSRLFADWKIHSQGQAYDVEVRYTDGNVRGAGSEGFIATVKNHKPQISIKHTDTTVLRKKIQEALDASEPLEWRNVLIIGVKGHFDTSGSDEKPGALKIGGWTGELTVGVERMQLSINRAGQKVHRGGDDGHPHGGWPHEGVPPPDRRHMTRDFDDMAAVIDDTPENREALKLLIEKMKGLRDGLCDLMHPQRIQQTLKDVKAGGTLLLADGKKGKPQ